MRCKVTAAAWEAVFAVPTEVVDTHIKLCGSASLKLLLLLLRAPGHCAAVDELGSRLGLSAADAADALRYWVECGMVEMQGEAPVSAPVTQPPAALGEAPAPMPAPEAPTVAAEEPRALPTGRRPRYSRSDVLRMAADDLSLRQLSEEAQRLLGKTLTSVDLDTLTALYSYYNLSPHYILSLVCFCMEIGRGSMAYIESTAADWLKKEVGEADVDTHIAGLLERRTRIREAAEALGIRGRAPVAGERRYLETWLDDWGMPIELIRLAGERTLEQIHELRLAYTNSILKSWHVKGIRTMEAALTETKTDRPTGKKKPAAEPSAEDDELLRLSRAALSRHSER